MGCFGLTVRVHDGGGYSGSAHVHAGYTSPPPQPSYVPAHHPPHYTPPPPHYAPPPHYTPPAHHPPHYAPPPPHGHPHHPPHFY